MTQTLAWIFFAILLSLCYFSQARYPFTHLFHVTGSHSSDWGFDISRCLQITDCKANMPCTFQENWCSDARFSAWVQRYKDNSLVAWCKFCKKKLDISTMGKSALTSHNKSSKHKNIILHNARLATEPNLHRFLASPPTSSHTGPQREVLVGEQVDLHSDMQNSSGTGASSAPNVQIPAADAVEASTSISNAPSQCNQNSFSRYYDKLATTKAEVLWAFRLVDKNQSFSSSTDSPYTFQEMFPDSSIAKNFTCSETKVMYLVNFALKPYCKQLLMKKVNQSESIVLLFDESLNHLLQKNNVIFTFVCGVMG